MTGKALRIVLSAVFVAMLFTTCKSQDDMNPKDITYRPPTQAGRFYPENPDSLKAQIEEYLDLDSPKRLDFEPRGLIVPHAGYRFSGWVAGRAYRELEGADYDAVVVVGPSHRERFVGVSIFDGDAYVTPLGESLVDKDLAKNIAEFGDSDVYISRKGHNWLKSESEHSIEVQIPFLQYLLPGVPIVPISVGSQDLVIADKLMRALVAGIEKSGKKVLLVASSDLSHFKSYEEARSIDKPAVKAIQAYDYYKLASNFFSRRWEACGATPIVAVMSAAERLGANFAQPMLYATSADSPYIEADSSRVVGYASAVIVKARESAARLLPDLSEDDERRLIETAKKAVERTANNEVNEYPMRFASPNLAGEYAAFVTLRKNGDLRGCMGHTFSQSPLLVAVEQAGKLAASKDYRFGEVKPDELDEITYEVTILSRMKRIFSPEEIILGRDGIYIRKGANSAIFLPQVAPEQNWTKEEFFSNLCRKARLPLDAYEDPDALLYRFEAKVIDEEELGETD